MVLKNKNIKLQPSNNGYYGLSLWMFMNVFGEFMVYRGFEVNPYF